MTEISLSLTVYNRTNLRQSVRHSDVSRQGAFGRLRVEVHASRTDTHGQGRPRLAVSIGHQSLAGAGTGRQRLVTEVHVNGGAPPGVGEAVDDQTAAAVEVGFAVLDDHALVLHPHVQARVVAGVGVEWQVQLRGAHWRAETEREACWGVERVLPVCLDQGCC